MTPVIVSKQGFFALVLWVLKGWNGYRVIIRIETGHSNLVSCFGPRIWALARYFTSAFASVKYLSQGPHPRAKTWHKIWMTGLNPTIHKTSKDRNIPGMWMIIQTVFHKYYLKLSLAKLSYKMWHSTSQQCISLASCVLEIRYHHHQTSFDIGSSNALSPILVQSHYLIKTIWQVDLKLMWKFW